MKKTEIKFYFPKSRLSVKKVNKEEVREGWLFLKNKKFEIKDGIIYTPIKSKEVLKEQKAIYEIDKKPELGGSNQVKQKLYFEALKLLPWKVDNELFNGPGAFRNITLASQDFQKFLDFLAEQKRKLRILEIGADSCWATWQIAKRGHQVIGLDINHHLKLRDFWLKEKDIYFDCIRGEMADLPFENETFDLVFASEAIHHSQNLQKVAKEINRVLKSGGSFYFIREPMRGKFSKKNFGVEQKAVGISENLFTLGEWRKAFQISNFKNLKIELASLSWFKLWSHLTLKEKLIFILKDFKKKLLRIFPIFRQYTVSDYNFTGQKGEKEV